MEIFKVFGIQNVNFNDKDGKHVEGISLHCTTAVLPSDKWKGLAYEKLWCPLGSAAYSSALSVPAGSEVQVDFDRKGKPVSIVLYDPKQSKS